MIELMVHLKSKLLQKMRNNYLFKIFCIKKILSQLNLQKTDTKWKIEK